MRGLINWGVVLVVLLSLAWTTWRVRKALHKALGRKPRRNEEMSLKTWMDLPAESLDTANRELTRDPFDRLLRFLEKIGVFTPPPGAGR